MNLYDKAHELARALRESPEYAEMRAALAAAQGDADASRMLEDFRGRQAELQERFMKGEEPTAEEMERMEKLYKVIGLNAIVRRLFEAERRLAVVTEDVQRITSEPLAQLYKQQ